MPRKKKISDISLELSELQRQYLSSDIATLEGLNISLSEYNKWQKEAPFRWIEVFILNELVAFDEIDKDVTKGAALVIAGYSYSEVESALSLAAGTILEWMHGDSEPCEFFRKLVELGESERENESGSDDREEQYEKSEQMIPLILMGKNNTEIAEALGVSRQTVSAWRQEDGFQDSFQREVVQLRESQRAALALLHDKAYQAIHDLLESKEDSIKLKAAVEILKSKR